MKLSNVNKDGVKSASVTDTMISAALGGVTNSVIGAALPNAPAWLVGIGEIAGGVMLGGMIGGKAGNIIQNGMVITGAANLSNMFVSLIGSLMGGSSSSASAADTANANVSAVVF